MFRSVLTLGLLAAVLRTSLAKPKGTEDEPLPRKPNQGQTSGKGGGNNKALAAGACDGSLTSVTAGDGSVLEPMPVGTGYNAGICRWVITAGAGKLIRLSVRTQSSCRHTYTYIADGDSDMDPELLDVCGSAQYEIVTTGNQAYVEFGARRKSGKKIGMEVMHEEVTPGVDPCGPGGVEVADAEGTAASQGFGAGGYANYLDCSWRIPNQANSMMMLEFTAFRLEGSDGCSYDWVDVMEGKDGQVADIGRFCGANGPVPFKTAADGVKVDFHSDYSVTDAGFEFSWSLQSAGTDDTSPPGCSSTLALTGDSGTFDSPNYGADYPSNADCSYQITLDSADKVIELTLTNFNVADCGYDALEGYMGTTATGSKAFSRCGVFADPQVIRISSHETLIKFVSDGFGQSSGFQASYQAITPPVRACGQNPIAMLPDTRIIGGKEVVPHSHPWQIRLLNGGSFTCGGAVISPKWVVTAAHCIGSGSYEVIAGDHSRSVVEGSEVRVAVIRKIVYPNYSGNSGDLALLELETELDLSKDEIKAICIPDEAVPVAGTLCITTGWGSVGYPTTSYIAPLQQVYLDLVSQADCTSAYGSSIDGTMICAGQDGRDACSGDSGGPLICQQDGVWQLHGITSWGRGCALEGYPGVWTRVTLFRDYIASIVPDINE